MAKVVDGVIVGDLFGELVFHESFEGGDDTYVIGFTRNLTNTDFRLCSYYVNPERCKQKPVHWYPLKLSELRRMAEEHGDIRAFVDQFDTDLVDELLCAGMDSLAAYALLFAHPPLRQLMH